jgi:hypothetical protein
MRGGWSRRSGAMRTGWGSPCRGGTVRILGTFLGENPTAVPARVVAFLSEQLGPQIRCACGVACGDDSLAWVGGLGDRAR